MEKRATLSPRQTEIMHLAAEGLTDKEIAQRTGLSLGTLRSHWDRMRARLNARSRGEVIARAAEDAQRTLLAEVEILRRAVGQRGLFVWSATSEGVVDYVNERFAQFSGRAQEEFLGLGCQALMPEEEHDASRERWGEAQRCAAGYRAQVTFRSASGLLVPHRIELAPLDVRDGRVVRWVGTAARIASPPVADAAGGRA